MRPCILHKTFDCGQNLIRNYYHFRKYTVRQVKEGTDKLTLVENSLCRIKLTENPLYSIRWGSTLPTIPEEDPDEYNVAITGYLTFHKPLRTTPVSDAPTGLKGGRSIIENLWLLRSRGALRINVHLCILYCVLKKAQYWL